LIVKEEALELSDSIKKDLDKIGRLLIQGEFVKAHDLLDFYEKENTTLNTQNRLSIILLKAKAKNKLFELSKALELINIVIKESEKYNKSLIYIDALLIKAEVVGQTGDLEGCYKAIDKATKCISKSSKRETYEFIKRTALIHNYNGSLQWLKGEFDKALQKYQIGLELGTKISNKYVIGASLSNIGAMYWRKGELSKALRFHDGSLIYFKNLKAKLEIAAVLGNLGEIYHQKGDLQQALEYHQQSLDIFKELNNIWHTPRELFCLISICVDLNSNGNRYAKKAEEYLSELETLSKRENNKVIRQRYRVAKALMLKKSPRTRDKAKAETIFQEIIQEKTFEYELTVIAILNLCDLFLLELRISGDPEILLEVQSLVNRLFDIAEQMPSYLLLSNVYLLKSKLALIELDIKKAKKFLDQAQQICEEKGLKRLAMSISNEYDVLLLQLAKWEEFIDKNAILTEKLEFADFQRMINQMLKNKMKELPLETKDDPVCLLILENRGTTIFTKNFNLKNNTMADDQIIGGFLTAINSFMQKTFSTTGFLERITHKDYTLILKTITPFTFCYAFKGQSYSAMIKLNDFITHVKNSDSIWDSFLRYFNSTILPEEEEKKALELIAEKIFL